MPDKKYVHHFLEKSAATFPEKTAVVHDSRRVSYAELNEMSNRFALWLISKGVRKGDRVVIVQENSVEYVASYYGILKAGGVTVSMSSDAKADGLVPLLEELQPACLVVQGKFEEMIHSCRTSVQNFPEMIVVNPRNPETLSRYSIEDFSAVTGNSSAANSDPAIDLNENDIASIIYTSGSTGQPKGVVLTHKNIVANTRSICSYLELSHADIQMVVLPFFYVMGKSLLNTHVSVGGTVVINNKFAFPASIVKQMIDEKVTGFSGVPSTYAYLLNRSPFAKSRDSLSSLRYCSQAGGHMSRQIKEELRKALPDSTKIFIMYGATEASARLSYLEPERLFEKIDSIGKPIPGVELKILDAQGVEVATGVVGEVVASGDNIMQGYWKDPETTAKVLDHHGYHTGDLGYRDEDGYIFLQGRKDNLLKTGGHRVSPQEIEDIIESCGAVIEVAVVGVPDEMLENRLVALAVVKDAATTSDQLIELAAAKLPKYKVPSVFVIVKALPKKPNGKIDKAGCKEIALGAQSVIEAK